MSFENNGNSVASAMAAFSHGYMPIPIRDGGKAPHLPGWTHLEWDSAKQIESAFTGYAKDGASGVGLLLGERSNGLVDVDMDHPKALRLRDALLPPSMMATGRAGRPRSHRWYRVADDLPGTRKYLMPDRSVIIELRSTGSQTVIPPTVHPSGELYRWEGEPWGGEEGPLVIRGQELAVRVATLAMCAILIDNWPAKGSRHDAYLALAGGLLRFGTEGVHPYWERNLPFLIETMADFTNDRDGANARVAEVMSTTLARLRDPEGQAVGFPRLGELIGVDHAEATRRMARELEQLAGNHRESVSTSAPGTTTIGVEEVLASSLDPLNRNPLAERLTTWDAVDLGPYLAGEIVPPDPTVFLRKCATQACKENHLHGDNKGLMYPGLVNELFGRSESAKSWIAMYVCTQEMAAGGRCLYVDLEDTPEGTLSRLKALGMGADDVESLFKYVHPEGPIGALERNRYTGRQEGSDEGMAAAASFHGIKEPDGVITGGLLHTFDPTLIILDGMTSLYGLHGLDTNDATSTDFIGSWIKRLCRNGRTTVIVIDHTGKGKDKSPIGAHHKKALIQGCQLRVDVITQPMPGKLGEVELVIFKDRPGGVRVHSGPIRAGNEQTAAIVTLDSRKPGVTKVTVRPIAKDELTVDNSDESVGTKLSRMNAVADRKQMILDFLTEEWVGSAKITEGIGLDPTSESDRKKVSTALADLRDSQQIDHRGNNRAAMEYRALPSAVPSP